MINFGIGFLTLGMFILVGRLYMDMTRQPQPTEQIQSLKKSMLLTSIVFFVIGIILMVLSLFEK